MDETAHIRCQIPSFGKAAGSSQYQHQVIITSFSVLAQNVIADGDL